jgi:hypothetical protein
MSDVDNNMNQMDTNHPPSLFGKYTEMKPSAIVGAFVILEAISFLGVYLLDPEVGSVHFWCSVAVITVFAGIYYTTLWLQARELSYPSFCLIIFCLLLVVCVVYGIHGFHAQDEDSAFEIFLFLLLFLLQAIASMPLLVALLFGIVSYLLSLFFINHRPRRQKKNVEKVAVDTVAIDERTQHPQVLLEPLPILHQIDTTQIAESVSLLVV